MKIQLFDQDKKTFIVEVSVTQDTTIADLKKLIPITGFKLQIIIPYIDSPVTLYSIDPDQIRLLDFIYYNSRFAEFGDNIKAYLSPHHGVRLQEDTNPLDEKAMRLIFRKKPSEYFHHLTPEAFAKPQEIKKEVPYNYKLLYSSPPVNTYCKDVKDKQANNKRFQEQAFHVVDKITEWGKKNGVFINQDREESLLFFKTQVFTPDYAGKQSNAYFETIKKNLESIWFELNNTSISIDLRKMACGDIIDSLGVCNGGLYTQSETVFFSLKLDNSPARILADTRTAIIKEFAAKLIHKRHVEIGYMMHIDNALFKYAKEEGWNPLISIDILNDEYINDLYRDGYLYADDIIEFNKYFIQQYSARKVFEVLAERYKNDLEQLSQKLGIKKGKGDWIICDSDFNLYVERVAAYFKSAGINVSLYDIFIFNDDNTAAKFDNITFNTFIIEQCKRCKLFSPDIFYCNADIYSYSDLMSPQSQTWKSLSEARDTNLPSVLAMAINKLPFEKCMSFVETLLKEKNWYNIIYDNPKFISNLLPLIEDHSKWQLITKNSRVEFSDIFLDYNKFTKLLQTLSLDDWLSVMKDTFLSTASINKLLNCAIEQGDYEMVKRLVLEAKIDINGVDDKGYTALLTAVRCQEYNILEWLADKANINQNTKHGTALALAAKQGDLCCIKDLIKAKANVHAYDKNAQPALHMACSNKVRIVKYLIEEAKLDKNLRNQQGDTPLHEAVSNENFAVVKYLMQEQKVQKEVKNLMGFTPLHIACSFSSHDITEYLAIQKAGLNEKNNEGDTPLHIAARTDAKLVTILLKSHADISIRNNKGETPLDVAKHNSKELEGLDESIIKENAQIIATLQKAQSTMSVASASVALFNHVPMEIDSVDSLSGTNNKRDFNTM